MDASTAWMKRDPIAFLSTGWCIYTGKAFALGFESKNCTESRRSTIVLKPYTHLANASTIMKPQCGTLNAKFVKVINAGEGKGPASCMQ